MFVATGTPSCFDGDFEGDRLLLALSFIEGPVNLGREFEECKDFVLLELDFRRRAIDFFAEFYSNSFRWD